MRVIVSKTLPNKYRNYTVVPSIEEAKKFKDIEILIVHTFTDKQLKASLFLSELKKEGVTNYMYVCSEPSTQIKFSITGLNGVYVPDEFYFDDEEDLDVLVEQFFAHELSTGLVPSEGGEYILRDFIARVVNDELMMLQTSAYRNQLQQAYNDVDHQLTTYRSTVQELGTTMNDFYTQVSTILQKYDEVQKANRELVEKLGAAVQRQPQHTSGFSNSIRTFQQTLIMVNSKVVLFHELAPCRYLTSFALGYYKHVKDVRNMRVKLIFVASPAKKVAEKYAKYTNISAESMRNTSLFEAGDIYYVSHPIKDVMTRVISGKHDVYIVVDRLYDTVPCIKCNQNFVLIQAASGETDIERFHMNLKDSLFSVNPVQGAFINIPSYNGYPKTESARLAQYIKAQADSYKAIDERLRL